LIVGDAVVNDGVSKSVQKPPCLQFWSGWLFLFWDWTNAPAFGILRILEGDSMTTSNSSASSAYFRIPQFTKGDLEEVMRSFQPHEIVELSGKRSRDDVPVFPYPDESKSDDLTR
jgi:hypothetical protein